MAGRLNGKTALIIGAGSVGQGWGNGRATAVLFAREGARVYASDVDEAASAQTAEAIRASGGEAFDLALDVTKGQDITAAFRRIEEDQGRLDVVVNNAGLNVRADFRHLSDADWVTIREVNLDGVVRIARDAFELMRASGNASLINVASIMGLRVAGGVGAYAASKAGLIHMTRAMALEWARYGIRVNALAPGYIETDMNGEFLKSESGQKLLARIPQRRFGKKRELNGPLLLLASDASSLMTGSVITADGGHLISSL